MIATRVRPVGLGQAALGGEGDELVAYGLGSCVGLVLWSPERRIGWLGHVVLPASGGEPPDPARPARYADWAVAGALAVLAALGIGRAGLVAKLVGGAHVLETAVGEEIGAQNLAALRAELDRAGVRIAACDVGGRVGRTIRFRPAAGEVEVWTPGGRTIAL